MIESLRHLPGDFAVLGAGGKMGFHVAAMLSRSLKALGSNANVFAVSRFRSPKQRALCESAGLNVIAADLSDWAALQSLPTCENIFFLAGVKFGTAADSTLLHKMNVEMPRLVAERFCDSRIVAFSTGCVYSFVPPASGGSTESCATNPIGDYAISCKGREQAFYNAAEKSGTRSSLIRLNYANEPRYGVLVDIAQKVLAGEPVDVSMGYVNVIWQGDAIQHSIRSLEYASAPPFVLNVTGAEILSVREIAAAFADKFHRKVEFTGVEAPTAWLNNAAKSHNMFGSPQVSVAQMIDYVAAWLGAGNEVLGKPTHFETRDGKY